MSVEFNHTTAFIGMRNFDQELTENDDNEYEVGFNPFVVFLDTFVYYIFLVEKQEKKDFG